MIWGIFTLVQTAQSFFIFEIYGSPGSTNLWMSADDGATWRKIWSEQTTIEYASFSTDGSKIVLEYENSSVYQQTAVRVG